MVPSDALFGPFDAAGGHRDVVFALLQTVLVASIGYIAAARFAVAPAHAQRWKLVIVAVTAVDVAVANAWLVSTAPAQYWQSPAEMATYIRARAGAAAEIPGPSARVYRGNVASWRPSNFKTTGSPDRPAEIVAWEHATLFPKHHLLEGLSLVDSYASVKSADYESLFRVGKEHGPLQSDQTMLPQPTLLRLLGVEYLVLPDQHRPRFADQIDESNFQAMHDEATPAPPMPKEAVLWRMQRTLPRVWIVHDIETMSELPTRASARILDQRSSDVLFPAGHARDFSQTAVIETNQPRPEWTSAHQPGPGEVTGSEIEQCTIRRYEPQRVVIDAVLARPGLVVLSDAWYPGWHASVASGEETRAAMVYRTNRVCRGVWMPAGEHTIEYRFRSTSFERGAWMSGASWLFVVGVVVGRLIRRRSFPPRRLAQWHASSSPPGRRGSTSIRCATSRMPPAAAWGRHWRRRPSPRDTKSLLSAALSRSNIPLRLKCGGSSRPKISSPFAGKFFPPATA